MSSAEVLSSKELLDLFEFGREQSRVEFKSAGSLSDKRFACIVIRAMLGMANRRDGGLVIVGVTEATTGLELEGVDVPDATSWEYGRLADLVAQYAEPPIEFDLRVVEANDRKFVVIAVSEFSQTPVLCRRDYSSGADKTKILREGALYVRPRRKPETAEVATYADMRDLIDLATEKSLRRLKSTLERVGSSPLDDERDRAAFDAQLGTVATQTIEQVIGSRGFWRVAVAPERFDVSRIPALAQAGDIVERSSVEVGSLPFPWRDRSPLLRGTDSVGLERQAGEYVQSWRFFQSGQLVLFEGFIEDWEDFSPLPPRKADWKPGRVLSIANAVVTLYQAFQFAARLSANLSGTDSIRVSISAFGLRNRVLEFDMPNRTGFSYPRQADVPLWEYSTSLTRADWRSGAVANAATAAVHLFERFHWDANTEFIRQLMRDLHLPE
ncbi:MAG: putative DNA binding domain-containing protein [Gemmatimonadaceae bacterium]|nr:putative DNA binding domain-containing protein [Gemmatimonadaceae bacterium]